MIYFPQHLTHNNKILKTHLHIFLHACKNKLKYGTSDNGNQDLKIFNVLHNLHKFYIIRIVFIF